MRNVIIIIPVQLLLLSKEVSKIKFSMMLFTWSSASPHLTLSAHALRLWTTYASQKELLLSRFSVCIGKWAAPVKVIFIEYNKKNVITIYLKDVEFWKVNALCKPDRAALKIQGKPPTKLKPSYPVVPCSERCRVSINVIHDKKLVTFLKNYIFITLSMNKILGKAWTS